MNSTDETPETRHRVPATTQHRLVLANNYNNATIHLTITITDTDHHQFVIRNSRAVVQHTARHHEKTLDRQAHRVAPQFQHRIIARI